MKDKTLRLLICIAVIFYGCSSPQQDSTSEETTPQESTVENTETDTQGWTYLFDGNEISGWHNYLKDGVEGWYVQDGMLITDGGNGDIVTDKEYGNFELEFEYSISPEGNSGVFYKIIEDEKYNVTYVTGPEYQIIDDENYPAELKPAQHTAANYDLHVPENINPNPPGSFNKAKIVVNEGNVEHWLNGDLIVSYKVGSEDWQQRVDNSKFAEMEGYAKAEKGRIGLQDHGDKVMFKSIRIKEL